MIEIDENTPYTNEQITNLHKVLKRLGRPYFRKKNILNQSQPLRPTINSDKSLIISIDNKTIITLAGPSNEDELIGYAHLLITHRVERVVVLINDVLPKKNYATYFSHAFSIGWEKKVKNLKLRYKLDFGYNMMEESIQQHYADSYTKTSVFFQRDEDSQSKKLKVHCFPLKTRDYIRITEENINALYKIFQHWKAETPIAIQYQPEQNASAYLILTFLLFNEFETIFDRKNNTATAISIYKYSNKLSQQWPEYSIAYHQLVSAVNSAIALHSEHLARQAPKKTSINSFLTGTISRFKGLFSSNDSSQRNKTPVQETIEQEPLIDKPFQKSL
jgi:hypothetical protein